MKKNTQLRNYQKRPHSGSYRKCQHAVRNRRNLFRQNLKVRLRYCNQKPQHKADRQRENHFFRLAHLHAHAFAHRHHGHIHPKRKKAHPNNQKHRAEQKQHQRTGGQRRNRDTQKQYDGCQRKDRRQ